ncbi:hypothetical protein [Microbulbifer sp. GL-2]|uniref:hypothetical protein n=1 Tax=Microbulbifer sp. GL-2 TaxID=2591606 RepID=UPI001162CE9E|nr:hypothetical protein [Microbulbifer sp. GL-2]BBM03112.1 hypothetical protein GL2_31860 [Microbulbifer sp. GL-2]
MKKILIFFAAGCLGALANSLMVWLFGALGITSALGVSIAPALSAEWLYPRIVWGGIWGLFFLLPFLSSKLLLKGAILSLLPSAFQLFVVFPMMTGNGVAGFGLGMLTPIFVLFFNWVWGVVVALAIKSAR